MCLKLVKNLINEALKIFDDGSFGMVVNIQSEISISEKKVYGEPKCDVFESFTCLVEKRR